MAAAKAAAAKAQPGTKAGSPAAPDATKLGISALQGRRVSVGGPGAAPLAAAFQCPPRAAQSGGLAAQQAGDGLLKATVHEPFMLVVRTAQSLGLDTGLCPDFHRKPLENEALPRLEATLARLKQAIRALPAHSARHLSLLDHLIQTQAAIAFALGQQAAPSGYRGIERRGVPADGGPKPPPA